MFHTLRSCGSGTGRGAPGLCPHPGAFHHGGIRTTFSQGCAVLSD